MNYLSSKSRIILFVFILIPVFCLAKIDPLKGYSQIVTKKSKPNVNLVSKDTAFTKLSSVEATESNLTMEDSVVAYSGDQLLLSNYKLFKFKSKNSNPKQYSIKIYSMCDCWGFKKFIFVPQISVMDKAGKTIEKKEVESKFLYPEVDSRMSLQKTWVTESTTEQNISIVVYSDNSQLNTDVFKFVMLPVFLPINIKTSLVGDFYIKIEELK